MIAKYKQGKPEIDAYELPVVPVMIMPTYTEDWRFSERMLAELSTIQSANIAAQWAIQMIAELQARWVDATDRLQKIEELSRS